MFRNNNIIKISLFNKNVFIIYRIVYYEYIQKYYWKGNLWFFNFKLNHNLIQTFSFNGWVNILVIKKSLFFIYKLILFFLWFKLYFEFNQFILYLLISNILFYFYFYNKSYIYFLHHNVSYFNNQIFFK